MTNPRNATICKHLFRKLPNGFFAIAHGGGLAVHSENQICGSDRIVDVWQDISFQWHWRSIYLANELAGTGSVFDGIIAVQRAVNVAQEMSRQLRWA